MERNTHSTKEIPGTTTAIRQLSYKDYTVGWICALSTEHIAAVAFLDETHKPLAVWNPGDDNSYTLGRYGGHNTVIAVLPSGEYGKSSAASVARDMLRSFPNIRIGLMVGIGGGAPNQSNDIRLGDVVVSIPKHGKGGVLHYDMGKDIQDEEFQISGFLDQPPRVLRAAVQSLRTEYKLYGHQLEEKIEAVLRSRKRLREEYSRPSYDSDRLYRSDILHKSKLCCGVPVNDDPSILVKRPQRDAEDSIVVHYGVIASGDTLMKNAIFRDRLSEDQNILCFEMEAAGLMNHFPCLVVRGICDYSDTHKNKQWQEYAAMTATAYAKDLLAHMPIYGVESEQTIADHLQQLGQDLNFIDSKISNVGEKLSVNLLPVAYGAMFDSHSEEHNHLCLPDTRVDLLDAISQWADDREREAVFWLNGMAGTGKSTISRTLSLSFSKSRRLGASFFFKRGEADRSVAARFFTTIAAQLLRTEPAIARYIKEVLDNDPSIVQKSLSEQFQKLILKPLSNLPDEFQQQEPLLVVVDALDECDREEDIRKIIKLFSLTKIQAPRLRIFITSRPELPLRLGFNDLSGRYEKFILHEISHSVIKKDMHTFLSHELRVRRKEYNEFVKSEMRYLPSDWPDESDIRALLDITVPLFISAVTICRFLFDRYVSGTPAMKLRAVLQHQMVFQEPPKSNSLLLSHLHKSKMNYIYEPILAQMLRGLSAQEKETVFTEFRVIVGSIVVLTTPLSASALGRMLNIAEIIIGNRLDHLHSVLSVPESAEEPIRLFHLSFRDFLLVTEKRERPNFWIDGREAHRQLKTNCLRVMTNSLKKDMCNLRWPGSTRPSSKRVDECLRPEVQYACQYWVHHTEQSGDFLQDDDEVHDFLKIHLLQWIEAMSLIGRIDEALINMVLLQSRLQEQPRMLSEFLHDVLCFMRANMVIMRTAPLQIWSSALVFAPKESIVRQTYRNDIPRYISSLPQTQTSWDTYLFTFDVGHINIRDVNFSPDGTLIASALHGRIIRIYSTATGYWKHELIQHWNKEFCSAAFSPDGTQLVSVSRATEGSDIIQLWSVDTAALEQETSMGSTTGFDYTTYFLTVFSPDGKYVALCGNYKVQIWSIDTGTLGYLITLNLQNAMFIAFSANSRSLVAASGDGVISSWSVGTGTREKTTKVRVEDSHTVFNISPDATLVATGKNGTTGVSLWSADTGKLRQTVQAYVDRLSFGSQWCEFSPNSKHLATVNDRTIDVWSIQTGALQQTLECCDGIMRLAFSPDATLLASGHFGKVQLWPVRPATATEGDNSKHWRHKSEIWHMRDFGFLDCVAFSPDESFVISATRDNNEVLLWNTTKGSIKHRLQVPSYRLPRQKTVLISPNSQLVAASPAFSDNLDYGMVRSKVHLWSTITGLRLGSFTGYLLTFSPNSGFVAIAKMDYTGQHIIQIWCNSSSLDRRHEGCGVLHLLLRRRQGQNTLKLLRNLLCNSTVTSISFSCDSQLITTSKDGLLRVWSISGTLQWEVDGYLGLDPQDVAPMVAFSPDSRLMVIVNGSGYIPIISTASFRQQRRLALSEGLRIYAITFSPDSSLLAAAERGSIYLWSVSTGTFLHTFLFGYLRVNQLSFDKTGQFLSSHVGPGQLSPDRWQSITTEMTSTTSVSTFDEPHRTSCQWHGYGVSKDKCWVTLNGENLLWLPEDFRPDCHFDVSSSYIVIGTKTGRVIIIGFSNSLLRDLLDEITNKHGPHRE
ncbi:putative WD-repeat protein [Xylaria cf. heliscus]|nr:putative WD-repeat protein [Xylaria cf. heliscus]